MRPEEWLGHGQPYELPEWGLSPSREGGLATCSLASVRFLSHPQPSAPYTHEAAGLTAYARKPIWGLRQAGYNPVLKKTQVPKTDHAIKSALTVRGGLKQGESNLHGTLAVSGGCTLAFSVWQLPFLTISCLRKCVKATSRGEGQQMGKHLCALCESFENYFFTLFEGLEDNVTQHSL